MNNGNFEDIIRKKLEDHETHVQADDWQAIEKRLPGRRVSFYRSFSRYAAVAALLAGGVWLALQWFPAPAPRIAEGHVPELSVPDSDPVVPDSEPMPATGQKDGTVPTIHSRPRGAARMKGTKPVTAEVLPFSSESSSSVASGHFAESEKQPERAGDTKQEAEVKKEFPAVSEEEQAEYERKIREFEQEGRKTDFFEKQTKKKQSGLSFGLMAYNAITSKSSLGNNEALNSSQPFRKPSELSLLSAPVYTYTHQVPLSFGLTAGKNFGPHWGIETGVVYTYLRSEFKDNEMVTRGKQDLHYIGIPLNLSYHFAEWRNFSVYLSFGARADFNVAARQIAVAGSERELINADIKLKDDHIQWSLQLKPGVAYSFTRWLNVYAEPGVAWYIDNGSDIKNIWKDKPVTFALQVGLKTNF